MKKIIVVILFVILVLAINTKFCYASSSTTYFYSEGIKIDEKEIEIISYESKIDILTSKVKTVAYLQNNSDKEIITEIIIPINNKEFDITTNSVIIKLNDEKMQLLKNENGDFFVRTKFYSNSVKKLYYEYITDNDLNNAKVIKCNFENFDGRTVKKLKIDVRIDDRNVPLVEKIYPGHYSFKENVISIEYYNYTPSTITKEFIIQKETFNNLLYGREKNWDDFEKKIIAEWFNGNTKFKLPKNEYPCGTAKDILEYSLIKNQKYVAGSDSLPPLVYQAFIENVNDKKIKSYNNFEAKLYGKTICIEFAETEENKTLYVKQDIYNEKDEKIEQKLVEHPEREILKTSYGNTQTYGARVIYVGEGINGEDLNATTEEIVQYVNSINSDLYIRIEIYDGKITEKPLKAGKILYKNGGYVEYFEKEDYNEETDEVQYKFVRIGEGLVGYYDDKNYEVAKGFATMSFNKELVDKQTFNNEESQYRQEYSLYYKNYEEYKKNYLNDYYKETLKKFSNQLISSNSKVPTVIQFVGNRKQENGKYVVEFFEDSGFYNSSVRGIETVDSALKTISAKKIISENTKYNKDLKASVDAEIKNLKISDDEKKIQEELQTEKIIKENANKNILYLDKKDILVYSVIGVFAFVCIILLILKRLQFSKKN